ncbi:uncharacterized protein MKZ38_007344 [Zalerion maritima]|uniref:Uncharacterized protein n=1 Tax=Zalerion maritima TaxID=339359 RepID=A0AAD5WWI7_9PEZI|nr:uncharacterized protein MKZ38_007344 [Zalerion maritima]
MFLLSSLFLVGLAAALPVDEGKVTTTDTDCPRTLCIDGLSPCGTRWGGCYDVCQPTLSPTMPPCETEAPEATTSAISISTIETTTVSNCSSQTVCWDGINECGQTYGGCFPDCTPWPTFTPPPCNETSTAASAPTTTLSSTTTGDDCSGMTVCADYVNECGMWYGGCFPDCTPWPTFSPPACPTTTTITTMDDMDVTSSIATSTEEDCMTQTVCIDMGNECGMMYGSCFPNCTPWPTITPPPCPDGGNSSTTATTITTTPSTSNSSTTTPTTMTTSELVPVPAPTGDECPWLCVDYINDCGMMYGGCFEECPGAPWPTFEAPPCPSESSTATSGSTTMTIKTVY